MRGFPLGIFYPAPEVYEMSMACSRLTHYDPVGGHCSAFLNVMVSDMVRGNVPVAGIPACTIALHGSGGACSAGKLSGA